MANLDTNAVLRWLIDDIPQQTRAVEHLLSECGEVTVHDAALIECVYALQTVYKASRPAIATALSTLLGHGAFRIDTALWRDIIADYLAHPKLSVVDIYLTHQARRAGDTPLYTFDQKLANQLDDAELVSPTSGH
ncbi:MAG: PIN domain-containing protein [Propionibacteriaceae bacterium]|jgi:predicted nucleic-acid-binding protein|nr:PIN domain-containing protein [Propionibacteriaceae bacterium]